jgi:hypothetical protein
MYFFSFSEKIAKCYKAFRDKKIISFISSFSKICIQLLQILFWDSFLFQLINYGIHTTANKLMAFYNKEHEYDIGEYQKLL